MLYKENSVLALMGVEGLIINIYYEKPFCVVIETMKMTAMLMIMVMTNLITSAKLMASSIPGKAPNSSLIIPLPMDIKPVKKKPHDNDKFELYKNILQISATTTTIMIGMMMMMIKTM